MVATLRQLRGRIKSVNATKKITRAFELIAASRVVKAQQRASAAAPYARELTRAVSAVATFSNVDHPLTTEPDDSRRVAVLVVTSDRGLAGAYSSAVLRDAERLGEQLRSEGKEIDLYVTGRKGVAYYSFRQRPIVERWTGFSDTPNYDVAREIADKLIEAFVADEGENAVHEVHVVYTRFKSMLIQEPTTVRLLPLEVVEAEERAAGRPAAPAVRLRAVTGRGARRSAAPIRPEPHLLLPAAGRSLGARVEATCDEVGDGQR